MELLQLLLVGAIASVVLGTLTKEGYWRVLTESTREGKDWRHSCGTWVLVKEVILSERDGVGAFSGREVRRMMIVPFCPRCEREPTHGTFGPGKREMHIYS